MSVILDKKFQKVGETEKIDKKYAYSDFFVGTEGLYISQNHIENEEANEDYLNFQLFKLVEL